MKNNDESIDDFIKAIIAEGKSKEKQKKNEEDYSGERYPSIDRPGQKGIEAERE